MSYKELQSTDGSFNTPKYLFNYLNRFFKFELDPCDSGNNWLCLPHSFTKEQDGLSQEWNYNTFVNPPYGNDNENMWIDKLREERKKYRDNHYFILLPAKTESNWFENMMTYADITIFLRPRVSFIKEGKVKNGNNIGSIIFGMRGLNSKGLEDLNKFIVFSIHPQLGFNFKTTNDGYDSHMLFVNLLKLKKVFL